MWHGFKTENQYINSLVQAMESEQSNNVGYSAKQEQKFWEGAIKLPEGYKFEKDPSGRSLNTPGAKADAGKLRPWLVLGAFSHALEEVAKVGTAGAKKYTPNGWKTVPDAEDRYMEAFMRHLLELGKGNEIDDGPNGVYTHHIANMIWNLCAVLELKLSEKSTDKT